MADAPVEPKNDKKTRRRNPAHPVLTLAEALVQVQVLYTKESMRPIAPVVVAKHWGLSINGSTALQAISSLKQYGLLEEKITDDKRQVMVTNCARRILMDRRPDSTDRLAVIREAALAPKIMAELWEQSDGGHASDDSLLHYLTFERPESRFYEDSAPGVLETFRQNIDFAKLKDGDIIDLDKDKDNDKLPKTVKHGDYIQWESQGAAQFLQPRRVTGISDDGLWVFVEGTKAGIPATELKVVDPPIGVSTVIQNPPANPNFTETPSGDAVPISVLMGKGAAQIINIPKMTSKAFLFFKTQLDAFEDAIVSDGSEPTESDPDS